VHARVITTTRSDDVRDLELGRNTFQHFCSRSTSFPSALEVLQDYALYKFTIDIDINNCCAHIFRVYRTYICTCFIKTALVTKMLIHTPIILIVVSARQHAERAICYRLSVRLSVCPSVRHTGGSVENG